MTDQENKFLERIGITSGPWYHDTDGKIFVYDKEGSAEWLGEVIISNGDFVAKAPEMFLEIWEDITNTWDEKITDEKSQKKYERKRKIIMNATGRTISNLLKLWEECK